RPPQFREDRRLRRATHHRKPAPLRRHAHVGSRREALHRPQPLPVPPGLPRRRARELRQRGPESPAHQPGELRDLRHVDRRGPTRGAPVPRRPVHRRIETARLPAPVRGVLPAKTGRRRLSPARNLLEVYMSDHIYKITELTGSSPKSIEDAVQQAVIRAAKTLRNLRWFEITETR